MDRITAPKLRDAFRAFQTAYASAGLHTVIRHPDPENPGGEWLEYRTGALDLVLTVPGDYQAGRITVEPWHNPVAPQRWSGSSGGSSPATPDLLGNTMRAAYDRLTAMTGTLWAVTGANRDNLLYRDSAALRYLNGQDGPQYVDTRDADPERDARIADSRALDLIHAELSGTEWSSDTAPAVAELVALTGRLVADLDDEAADR